MDDRLHHDGSQWWFRLRGGDLAGPYASAEDARAALARFRRRCQRGWTLPVTFRRSA